MTNGNVLEILDSANSSIANITVVEAHRNTTAPLRVDCTHEGRGLASMICPSYKPTSSKDLACKQSPLKCEFLIDMMHRVHSCTGSTVKAADVICVPYVDVTGSPRYVSEPTKAKPQKKQQEGEDMARICDLCNHKGQVVETTKSIGINGHRREFPVIDVCNEHAKQVKSLSGPEFVQLGVLLTEEKEISISDAEGMLTAAGVVFR